MGFWMQYSAVFTIKYTLKRPWGDNDVKQDISLGSDTGICLLCHK